MAYRDVRNLCEMLRQLGYPRRVSLENFRLPNFKLVAEMLYWMVQRYDPTAEVSDNIDEEDDRINFIRGVAQHFATKARLKLQPLKLYQANENAVKELLKIAAMLNKAASSSGLEEEEVSSVEFSLSSKLYNLKQARQLASEITEAGANLHTRLGREKEAKEARTRAMEFLDSISRNLDSNREQEYIEKCIREIITSNKDNLMQMEKMAENLKSDELTLEQKIRRKGEELERAEKRLKSIENVRPAFMDEYEQLEGELQRLYSIYVEEVRNLDFVETELDEYSRIETEARLESERRIEELRNHIIQEEEMKLITGEEELDEELVDEQAQKAAEEMRETRAGFHKMRPPDNQPGMRGAGKLPSEAVQQPEMDSQEEEELGESGEMIEGDEEEQLSDSALNHQLASLNKRNKRAEAQSFELIEEDEPDNDFQSTSFNSE